MATQVPDHSAQSDASTQEQPTVAESEVVRLRRELTEALEQQTATADILRVIASSPTDLDRVLQSITETAARLCDAPSATLQQGSVADGRIVVRAAFGRAVEILARPKRDGKGDLEVFELSSRTCSGRCLLERQVVNVADMAEATKAEYPGSRAMHLQFGQRSQAMVPLLRQGEAIGLIAFHRIEVDPFTDRQIALLESFANQAVIAIDNARLFQELQDRTAELAELNHTLEARVNEQVDQLERVGRLRRYLSPQLADMLSPPAMNPS